MLKMLSQLKSTMDSVDEVFKQPLTVQKGAKEFFQIQSFWLLTKLNHFYERVRNVSKTRRMAFIVPNSGLKDTGSG